MNVTTSEIYSEIFKAQSALQNAGMVNEFLNATVSHMPYYVRQVPMELFMSADDILSEIINSLDTDTELYKELFAILQTLHNMFE